MSRYRNRKSAYYPRNDSYSRSYNAEQAESEGRLPRTRAAARLGLSVKAFDAGCRAANYHTTEWHHVGKYAACVDYYDTTVLEGLAAFWAGAAAAYKTRAKIAELTEKASQVALAERDETRAAFAARLKRNGDCTRPVPTHSTSDNYRRQVHRLFYGAARISPCSTWVGHVVFADGTSTPEPPEVRYFTRGAHRAISAAEMERCKNNASYARLRAAVAEAETETERAHARALREDEGRALHAERLAYVAGNSTLLAEIVAATMSAPYGRGIVLNGLPLICPGRLRARDTVAHVMHRFADPLPNSHSDSAALGFLQDIRSALSKNNAPQNLSLALPIL